MDKLPKVSNKAIEWDELQGNQPLATHVLDVRLLDLALLVTLHNHQTDSLSYQAFKLTPRQAALLNTVEDITIGWDAQGELQFNFKFPE